MNAKRGYYSLIQYCPDPGRLEAVNLGVLLFCPEVGFLEAKIGSNNDRVRKFFGRESFDNWALNKAKQALVARLYLDRAQLQTLEDLEQFIQTRANEVILSNLRPVKVLKNPQKELDDLFRELVGNERRQRRSKPVVPELEAVFQRLLQEGRAVMDYSAKVPVVGKTVRVPYAYRNGAVNLVKPEKFSDVESVATDTAMKLAIEGDLLQRYGKDQEGEKKLIVVPTFGGEKPNPDVENRVVRVLKEYQVKTVVPADLLQFVAEVEKEAH
jgi:hypothetical protein